MKKTGGNAPVLARFYFTAGAENSWRRRSSVMMPGRAGFTLVETMMSILIITMFFATVLLGYTRATQRAQWSGYSLAAEAQSLRMMEECRSLIWDTQAVPVQNNILAITNSLNNPLVLPLDLPIAGTNVIYATNTATLSTISGFGNNASVLMITVTTTWPWNGKTFTNTIIDYRAPTQ